MKQLIRINVLLFCFTIIVNIGNSQSNTVTVEKEIPIGVEPKPVIDFSIKNVYESIPFQGQSMQGYLGKRYAQNFEERILKVDEKGLMAGYLQRPGVHPWIGEHIGKYLESATNIWKKTHDPRLKKQMDRMMLELIHSQLEDGYLGTYIPKEYWTSWDVWSHKYNMYGLLAYYTATGYQPALEACKKMGDLLCKTFGYGAGQRDILLAGEHMGMAATSVLDPMVDLYRFTGQKKYLDFCNYILKAWDQDNGPKVITAMLATGNVTKVGNGKAYEMLSNYVGVAKLYRLTGDERLLKVVKMAWQDIVKNRLYISGTTSSMEYFQVDKILPATSKDNMGEGCVTTTWIQLNQNLLAITGDLIYLEQIEQSIYNQLLAAENPQTGCVSYYTPLIDKKPYSCEISCCTSSVPRGIAMIPYFTMGNIKNVPSIMLYEPGIYKDVFTTVRNKKIDFSIKVESNFPESGNFDITVNTFSHKDSLPIAFRVPSWCKSFSIKVGNKEYKGLPNNFITIHRIWNATEKLKINFDINLSSITGGKSYPGMIAFKYGPQVLAFDESLNQDLLSKDSTILGSKIGTVKLIVKSKTELLPKHWIGKQAYVFTINNDQRIVLVPFADASQTGASMRVWVPLKPTE